MQTAVSLGAGMLGAPGDIVELGREAVRGGQALVRDYAADPIMDALGFAERPPAQEEPTTPIIPTSQNLSDALYNALGVAPPQGDDRTLSEIFGLNAGAGVAVDGAARVLNQSPLGKAGKILAPTAKTTMDLLGTLGASAGSAAHVAGFIRTAVHCSRLRAS